MSSSGGPGGGGGGGEGSASYMRPHPHPHPHPHPPGLGDPREGATRFPHPHLSNSSPLSNGSHVSAASRPLAVPPPPGGGGGMIHGSGVPPTSEGQAAASAPVAMPYGNSNLGGAGAGFRGAPPGVSSRAPEPSPATAAREAQEKRQALLSKIVKFEGLIFSNADPDLLSAFTKELRKIDDEFLKCHSVVAKAVKNYCRSISPSILRPPPSASPPPPGARQRLSADASPGARHVDAPPHRSVPNNGGVPHRGEPTRQSEQLFPPPQQLRPFDHQMPSQSPQSAHSMSSQPSHVNSFVSPQSGQHMSQSSHMGSPPSQKSFFDSQERKALPRDAEFSRGANQREERPPGEPGRFEHVLPPRHSPASSPPRHMDNGAPGAQPGRDAPARSAGSSLDEAPPGSQRPIRPTMGAGEPNGGRPASKSSGEPKSGRPAQERDESVVTPRRPPPSSSPVRVRPVCPPPSKIGERLAIVFNTYRLKTQAELVERYIKTHTEEYCASRNERYLPQDELNAIIKNLPRVRQMLESAQKDEQLAEKAPPRDKESSQPRPLDASRGASPGGARLQRPQPPEASSRSQSGSRGASPGVPGGARLERPQPPVSVSRSASPGGAPGGARLQRPQPQLTEQQPGNGRHARGVPQRFPPPERHPDIDKYLPPGMDNRPPPPADKRPPPSAAEESSRGDRGTRASRPRGVSNASSSYAASSHSSSSRPTAGAAAKKDWRERRSRSRSRSPHSRSGPADRSRPPAAYKGRCSPAQLRKIVDLFRARPRFFATQFSVLYRSVIRQEFVLEAHNYSKLTELLNDIPGVRLGGTPSKIEISYSPPQSREARPDSAARRRDEDAASGPRRSLPDAEKRRLTELFEYAPLIAEHNFRDLYEAEVDGGNGSGGGSGRRFEPEKFGFATVARALECIPQMEIYRDGGGRLIYQYAKIQCYPFKSAGVCECGLNCDFALESVRTHYRVRQCQHELKERGCPKGKSCQFLHTLSPYGRSSKPVQADAARPAGGKPRPSGGDKEKPKERIVLKVTHPSKIMRLCRYNGTSPRGCTNNACGFVHVCYFCGGLGHRAGTCTKKQQSSALSSSHCKYNRTANGCPLKACTWVHRCLLCCRTGHRTRDCPVTVST